MDLRRLDFSKLDIRWREVTWYSKALAAALFVALPFVGFVLGMRFEAARGPLQFVAIRTGGTVPAPTSTVPAPPPPGGAGGTLLAASHYDVPADVAFTLPDYPNVTFTVKKITRAEGGVHAPKCGNDGTHFYIPHPNLFSSPGTCVDADPEARGFVPALVIMELAIDNRSNVFVSTRALQLFYSDGALSSILADAAPAWDGYGTRPFGAETLPVGFIIPASQTTAQLIYGNYGKKGALQRPEDFFSNTLGGYLLDFTTRTLLPLPG